jgi:hypothetical protein
MDHNSDRSSNREPRLIFEFDPDPFRCIVIIKRERVPPPCGSDHRQANPASTDLDLNFQQRSRRDKVKGQRTLGETNTHHYGGRNQTFLYRRRNLERKEAIRSSINRDQLSSHHQITIDPEFSISTLNTLAHLVVEQVDLEEKERLIPTSLRLIHRHHHQHH